MGPGAIHLENWRLIMQETMGVLVLPLEQFSITCAAALNVMFVVFTIYTLVCTLVASPPMHIGSHNLISTNVGLNISLFSKRVYLFNSILYYDHGEACKAAIGENLSQKMFIRFVLSLSLQSEYIICDG